MPRGRVSIFEKDGRKYQGIVSAAAGVKFEAARKRLAELAGWADRTVSDADTLEFLARGEADTIKYLKSRP